MLTFLRARFNRSIDCSRDRSAGFAVTELRYTVIANTFRAIAAKQWRRIAKYPRFFVLWSQSQTSYLKSQTD
ncbi:hypothetical protein [Microcoleus sp. herbarium2]|uniref:hypothetical protein n=1 Tax=Microcoleus sp. herbarium2 TaxID=3055433 RepID=UPI002FD00D74